MVAKLAKKYSRGVRKPSFFAWSIVQSLMNILSSISQILKRKTLKVLLYQSVCGIMNIRMAKVRGRHLFIINKTKSRIPTFS